MGPGARLLGKLLAARAIRRAAMEGRPMPGNTTILKQARFWLPAVWGHVDFAAGQTSALALAINGWPAGLNAFSLPRQASLVSIGIELDAAVTAGFLRFQLTRNGSAVGPTWDMDSGTGQRRLVELTPGAWVGNKGDRVGISWGSNAGLTPAGAIDGVVLLEVEPV